MFFPPYLGLMKKLYSIRRFREKKKVPCRNKAKMFFPTISNFSGEVMFFKSVQIKMQQNNFSNHLRQTYMNTYWCLTIIQNFLTLSIKIFHLHNKTLQTTS